MMIENRTLSSQNIVINGKRGFGKTTKARNLIKHIKKEKTKAIIVLDPLNEYDGDYEITDIDLFYSMIFDSGLDIGKIYVLKFRRKAELYEVIDYIQSAHDVYLVIEEASIVTSPHFISEELSDIVNLGRHSNINYMAVCRRPAEISRELTSQAHTIISFRQTEKRDVQLLEYYGFDPENLKNLNVGEYIEIDL